jgi:class 3 adenylate cyclase
LEGSSTSGLVNALKCQNCSELVQAGWRFCPGCGTVLLPNEVHERRRVSVLFVDLVASTRLAKSYQSEEYFDLMGEILTVLAGEIEALGGHVVQFQGDAVLAAFGLVKTYADDSLRAMRSAKAALAAVTAYGKKVGLDLEGRAGIDVDEATTGWVGNEYTLFGSVVNLSRRLCSAAQPGEVLVSERGMTAVGGQAQFTVEQSLSIRDFNEERGPYRLLGFNTTQERAFDAPFQGRRRELAQLESWWLRANTQNVLVRAQIIGMPGVGKSRLLQAFTQRLEKQEVRCITIHPKHSSVSEDALARLSQHDSLVIVLEQAERLPPSFLKILEREREKPVLVIEHRVQPSNHVSDTLKLEPLAFVEARAITEAFAGPQPISLVKRWFEASGGNPWLLESYGRSAMELDIGAGNDAPEGVLRAVLGRLDELPRAARETLSAAALFGGSCYSGALESILGKPPSLQPLLETGWLTELSPSAIPGEREFTIPIPLVRSVAETLTALKSRKLWHFSLAVWFMERDPQRSREHMRLSNNVSGSRVRLDQRAGIFEPRVADPEAALSVALEPVDFLPDSSAVLLIEDGKRKVESADRLK